MRGYPLNDWLENYLLILVTSLTLVKHSCGYCFGPRFDLNDYYYLLHVFPPTSYSY